jgi:hypothetical protein
LELARGGPIILWSINCSFSNFHMLASNSKDNHQDDANGDDEYREKWERRRKREAEDKVLLEHLKQAYFDSFPASNDDANNTAMRRIFGARSQRQLFEAFQACPDSVLKGRMCYAQISGHLLSRPSMHSDGDGDDDGGDEREVEEREAAWTLWEQAAPWLVATAHHVPPPPEDVQRTFPDEQAVEKFMHDFLRPQPKDPERTRRFDQFLTKCRAQKTTNARIGTIQNAAPKDDGSSKGANDDSVSNSTKGAERSGFISASKLPINQPANNQALAPKRPNMGMANFVKRMAREEPMDVDPPTSSPSSSFANNARQRDGPETIPINQAFAYYNLGTRPQLLPPVKRAVQPVAKRAKEDGPTKKADGTSPPPLPLADERLANIDPKLVEAICSEVLLQVYPFMCVHMPIR